MQARHSLFAAAAALALVPAAALAVGYASGVVKTGDDVSFILNQDNSNVRVVLDNGAKILDLGTQGKGSHSFNMAGYSSYSIIVKTSEAPGWAKFSDDALTQSKYFSPRGVSVNRNAASPFFGNIYVAEGQGGAVAAGGRTTTDGLYAMGADQSDRYGQGNTASAGGVNWGLSSNSPFRITVAPDDSIYVADWSDAHSGVWRAAPTTAGNFEEVLDNTGRAGSGLVGNIHGSVAAVYVEGTGANTKLYTLDEDLAAAGDINRYDIGTTTSGYNQPPVKQTTDGQNHVQNFNMDLVRDKDGSWWVAQWRATDSNAAPSLMHWADGASQPMWISGANLKLDGGYGNLDLFGDTLAIGTNTGKIYIIDISDRNNPVVATTITHPGNQVRDVSFDAAGNLYAVSSSSETLRIYSPGGDWAAITRSDGTFALVPEPTTLALLALGGLALRRRVR